MSAIPYCPPTATDDEFDQYLREAMMNEAFVQALRWVQMRPVERARVLRVQRVQRRVARKVRAS